MHPERRRREAELAALADQGDWERLYQMLVLQEFPHEARMGWQLAFVRTLAVPRMARLMAGTREMMQHTRKRAYDTGLVIYEIVHAGVDSPVGHRMASLMNRAHRGYPITDEDMTYVLAAFIVSPIRHIARVGWRAPTVAERRAAHSFFARLGALMNIAEIPADYDATEAYFDAYEAANVAWCPEAEALGRRLVHELKTLQPLPLRPLTTRTFTALLDEPRIAAALGLKEPGPVFRAGVSAAVRVRAAITPLRRPRSESAFTPGQPVAGIYPHGYALDDLGPASTRSSVTDVTAEMRADNPPR